MTGYGNVKKWRGKKDGNIEGKGGGAFCQQFSPKLKIVWQGSLHWVHSMSDTVKHIQTEAYRIKDNQLTKKWPISAITLIHC